MTKNLSLVGFVVAALLLTVNPVLAGSESGRFSVGVFTGRANSIVENAAAGAYSIYPDTEFKSGGVIGGSLMYRFPAGYALELSVERLSMDLEELGVKFGTLNMTPVMFLFKVQDMPEGDTGLTGHADIGFGWSFNSFDKGPYITGLENTYGVTLDITVERSFVFELGAGADLFFTKNISANLDGRLLFGNVDTSGWEIDLETFHISNFQILFGMRYWY
ncbi:MAG TPA: hypothetical protein ENJ04_09730 [Nitrospirae bacterium]|nr:hypothetical protein [Nitrospirota bacterium]